MSRRICVELYKAIAALGPGWHHDDDTEGAVKIVMTGSAEDSGEWQLHIRNKTRREAQSPRFKDPHDPLRMVLIRNIWPSRL